MITLSVSQLNRYVKSVLEGDKKLSDLLVQGEISNFVNARSGHMYFSLKDREGAVRAVMFRQHAGALRFVPENGMSVIARGAVGVFERDGAYQFYVTDLLPQGAGALAVAFEQRRERMAARGLFDEAHKKQLPTMPSCIGVVTSRDGAAFQDILRVIGRRFPLCRVLLCPALVQGGKAPQTLVHGLKAIDGRCDVIILGRGGGSAEDLWAFNDEALVEAVYHAKTPVISAVGHETDYSLCDFVADVRAPTPSAAAEMATPSTERLLEQLDWYREALHRHAQGRLARAKQRVEEYASCPALQNPTLVIAKKQERLDFLSHSLYNNKRLYLERFSREITSKAALLDSLNPLKVLQRGYTAVFRDATPVGTASMLRDGDRVSIRFHDGEVNAVVEHRERNAHGQGHDI